MCTHVETSPFSTGTFCSSFLALLHSSLLVIADDGRESWFASVYQQWSCMAPSVK